MRGTLGRLLLVSSWLLPLAARAQVVTSPIKVTSDQSTALNSGTTPQIYVGRQACKDNRGITFTWDLGATPTPGLQAVTLIRAHTASTCGTTTLGAGDLSEDAPTQTQTGNKQYSPSDLLLDTGGSDGGLPGGCDNTTRSATSPYTTHFCVQLRPTTSTTASPTYGELPVNFAVASPPPPKDVAIREGDKHLRVSWSKGDSSGDIATYDVHLLPVGAQADGGAGQSVAGSTGGAASVDLTSTDDGTALVNGASYSVTIAAHDLYKNVSDPSAAMTGTPHQVDDFYNHYRQQGGSAGGCSTGGVSVWVFALAALTGLLARRRRKSRGGAMLLAFVALLAPQARAAERFQRPPRKALFALKIDRYDPKVDTEPGLTGTPYHDIFLTRAPLRYQLEVDWEVAHPFGSVLLGATVGYWQNFGKGLLVDGTRSDDTTLLDVIPFGVIATYRFDWLADRFARFPFIPYAQVGLQRALWASFSGTGSVSKREVEGSGGRGSGWTLGYTTAVGFAVSLDALDPALSREAYVDTGIQRTALFAEYGWTRLDNFHKRGGLVLSDRAWRFGLSLEF